MDAHNIRTCPWAQQGESGAVSLPPLEPCRTAFHDILCSNSLPIELQDPASQSSTKPSHGLGARDRAAGIARHVWHCGQRDTQRTPWSSSSLDRALPGSRNRQQLPEKTLVNWPTASTLPAFSVCEARMVSSPLGNVCVILRNSYGICAYCFSNCSWWFSNLGVPWLP